MPPTPAPAAELPKVMPLEDSPTRSIVPDDPCMSIEPRSARACRSFCSSVHTRVFFVAYLFLPKTGTATPWAWHRPPRDSSVLSTSFRQSPSSKSFLAPKQSDAGMPMAWQPLRNMLMLSICRKAMVDSETFLTLPGLIALISLHSRTCGRAASARGARNCGDAAARPGLQVREETERVVERVVRHRLDPGLRLLRVVHDELGWPRAKLLAALGRCLRTGWLHTARHGLRSSSASLAAPQDRTHAARVASRRHGTLEARRPTRSSTKTCD